MHAQGSIERFFRGGLKLTHLRMLVCLAELGQVTKVAAAFHVTQPAISKQIAEIEGNLGVALVIRSGNAVELTPIGQVIVSHGRDVLRQLELAQRDVSALASGTGGHVSVGAVVTVPEPLVANTISLFGRRAPLASVSFVEATLDRLLKLINEGEVDIVLGRNHVSSGLVPLQQKTLHREPFVFVVGREHALGDAGREVDWGDLQHCRWIWPLHGSPAFSTLTDTLAEHGIHTGSGGVESSSLALNIALISGGQFVSILPLSVARQHVMKGAMRILPLPPLEPLGEVVAYWRDAMAAPAAQLFMQCLLEVSGDLLRD